jgi:hypothetical protein
MSVIPVTWEVETVSLRHSVSKTPSQNISQKWWFTSIILVTWKMKVERTQSEGGLGRSARALSKTN